MSFGTACRTAVVCSLLAWSSNSFALVAAPRAGTVIGVSSGVLYIDGIPHFVVLVRTSASEEWVAVPNLNPFQELEQGEQLEFAGPTIKFGAKAVVNTKAGYVLRLNERSVASHMEELNSEPEMDEEEAHMGAVPTTVVETPEQLREVAARRRVDLLLTIMSIVLAFVAFERIQALLARMFQYIREWLARQNAK